MSDETIIVRNQGTIFLGGPPLVKASIGEEVSAEELGGGLMHSTRSGVTDHLADDDKHALELCRSIVENLNDTRRPVCSLTTPGGTAVRSARTLRHSAPHDHASRLICVRSSPVSSMARASTSSNRSMAPRWCAALPAWRATRWAFWPITAFCFLTPRSRARILSSCATSARFPLLFLQNISGFMVGVQAESGGIAKDGAKMVMAVANTKVPRFTLIVGGSFGAGNYGMCGRAYSPRLLFMWPSARISVMGGEQAAGVLFTVKQEQLRNDRQPLMGEAEERAFKQPILDTCTSSEGSPYYSTARLWDDGILDPLETRRVLGLAIAMAMKQPLEPPRYGIFRM